MSVYRNDSHAQPQYPLLASQQVQQNNTTSFDHYTSNSCADQSNQHNQPQQHLSANSLVYQLNQTCSKFNNYNNNNIYPQPLMNYPFGTRSQQHQHIPTLHNHQQQQAVTTNQTNNASNNSFNQHQVQRNTNQQKINQLLPLPNATPMESENDDNFTLVSRKKKKVKTDHLQPKLPPSISSSTTSTTSSDCINTDASTSSSNTNSILPSAAPSHSSQVHHNQEIRNKTSTICTSSEISVDARRYAETRYPFPPFIIKFNEEVDESITIKYIMNHYGSTYNVNLRLAGHRLKKKKELLIFVDDRDSFAVLYDDTKWPTTINSLVYDKIAPTHLPPQFSILIRNVPLEKNVNELIDDIKQDYPSVVNALRIFNRNKSPTTLVRLDIKCINTINELLIKKYMYVNNVRLTVVEYLAPAKVLICTKCFKLGHFRRTCNNKLDTCRVCGSEVADINQHKLECTTKRCCVRCSGDHESNDNRCPEVKSYRAILTKSLLTRPDPRLAQQQNKLNNYWFNDRDFPVLNGYQNQGQDNYQDNYRQINFHLNNVNQNDYDKQIDEMKNKMNELQVSFDKILELNNSFLDQHTRIQQVVSKHEHELNLQQYDVIFLKEFVSQFITPLCQTMVDVIPALVKKKIINDKSLTHSSLTAMSEKLTNELPIWTNRFTQNESIKAQLTKDFNTLYQNTSTDPSNCNNANDSAITNLQ
ncbi:unnamed protein product [Rotaria sp. Silwood2]|nr:unnamed protein product [Rotaria sp. Silwood2]